MVCLKWFFCSICHWYFLWRITLHRMECGGFFIMNKFMDSTLIVHLQSSKQSIHNPSVPHHTRLSLWSSPMAKVTWHYVVPALHHLSLTNDQIRDDGPCVVGRKRKSFFIQKWVAKHGLRVSMISISIGFCQAWVVGFIYYDWFITHEPPYNDSATLGFSISLPKTQNEQLYCLSITTSE